jgi:hypothetical protein
VKWQVVSVQTDTRVINCEGTDLMILMNLPRLFLFVLCVARDLAVDALGFAGSSFRSRTALIAENLFLRKQLAFYQERQIRPRRLTNAPGSRWSFGHASLPGDRLFLSSSPQP